MRSLAEEKVNRLSDAARATSKKVDEYVCSLAYEPCAFYDSPPMVLQPGEQAVVPVAWAGALPKGDFYCEPCGVDWSGVEALPGLCAGGEGDR